jgi:hypothetical protein
VCLHQQSGMSAHSYFGPTTHKYSGLAGSVKLKSYSPAWRLHVAPTAGLLGCRHREGPFDNRALTRRYLKSVSGVAGPQAVEHLDRQAAGVGVGLEHQWRDRAESAGKELPYTWNPAHQARAL